MRNFKEYLEVIEEGAPSWIKKMGVEDLKSYEKDHPSAKKITVDYIKRELLNRRMKSTKKPQWLVGKHQEHKMYVNPKTGKEEYSVDKYTEKKFMAGDTVVDPVYILKGENKTLSHYEDTAGKRYESDKVSEKEKTGARQRYGDKEEVEEKFKTAPNLDKHYQARLIKEIGFEDLSKDLEEIDKTKLSKAPYSKGNVLAFDKDGKYIGWFVGSSVSYDGLNLRNYNQGRIYGGYPKNANRKDIIAAGSKFLYSPEKESPMKIIRDIKSNVKASQKSDPLKTRQGLVEKDNPYYADKGAVTPAEKRPEKLKQSMGDKYLKYKEEKKDIVGKLQPKLDEKKKKVLEMIEKHISDQIDKTNTYYSSLTLPKIDNFLNSLRDLAYAVNQAKKMKETGKGDSYGQEEYMKILKEYDI